MKNLVIKTRIQKNYKEIFARFDRALFEALKPPGIKLKIMRFDGCKTNDEVHLKISPFPFISHNWISLITEHGESELELYFIDEGKLLPKPLKFWRHRHRIIKISENESEIIDDIVFTTRNNILDELLFPSLFTMFSLRKKIYQKYF